MVFSVVKCSFVCLSFHLVTVGHMFKTLLHHFTHSSLHFSMLGGGSLAIFFLQLTTYHSIFITPVCIFLCGGGIPCHFLEYQ